MADVRLATVMGLLEQTRTISAQCGAFRERLLTAYQSAEGGADDGWYRQLGEHVDTCVEHVVRTRAQMDGISENLQRLIVCLLDYEGTSLSGAAASAGQSASAVTACATAAPAVLAWLTQAKAQSMLHSYICAHNYTQADYSVFKKDPLWRCLMRRAYPDYQLQDLTQQEAEERLGAYMRSHNYGKADYALYSQDPLWRELVRYAEPGLELPPLRRRNADGSESNVYELFQVQRWLSQINPNYENPFLPARVQRQYSFNCGSCALALERRFQGSTAAAASEVNIGTDAGMEQATGLKCTYLQVNEIETVLKSRGAGAHLIVGINRKGFRAGHWFNAYYDGERIYTLDGQTGEVLDWPHDYGEVSEWCAML